MQNYLKTERFYLREFSLADVEDLTLLDSDPDVMKWVTNGKTNNVNIIKQRVEDTIKKMQEFEHKYGFWIAKDNQTDEFIGWFHLRPGKDDPQNVSTLEIGYRLLKPFWGKGMATEGSLALIKKAKEELRAKKIFATTMKKTLHPERFWKSVVLLFHMNIMMNDFL